MFLQKFRNFNSICIQCHDSPDADALGSGYALYEYFKETGKQVHFIYSGVNRITKPGLLMMVKQLDIPIEYTDTLPACEILITVDCQYEGGNITSLAAAQVAMIDHHPGCVAIDEWCYIDSRIGSCCTVVWGLLREEGYNVNARKQVATALYYGLYSDTGRLSEIYHEKDREMRDTLVIDREVLEQMISSNLSRQELQIAGEALTRYYFDEKARLAIVKTKPCDPNLLGVISDLVSQVAGIDMCVVYNETPIGYKMSIRSSVKYMEASALAGIISADIGSGGGHANKAGGFIMKKMLNRVYPECEFEQVLQKRIQERGKNI